MKPSLIFILLVLSIFLYETQGIRLNKLSIYATNHQELVLKSSSSNQVYGSNMATTEISSGTVIEARRLSAHGHRLPKIHEDYFGPRYHLPRHHQNPKHNYLVNVATKYLVGYYMV